MRSGALYAATVASVKAGQAGSPGQLKGSVSAGDPLGSLRINTPYGVFGTCGAWQGTAIPVAESEEVRPGPAQIMSNVSGDAVEIFQVEIVKVYDCDSTNGRDMMLQITDPELLRATGGIVAGMSGSPILMDGKLIGAVTHVLVNDPTMGYGIFIGNMLEAAE
jgi:stage IV sporulation protein B